VLRGLQPPYCPKLHGAAPQPLLKFWRPLMKGRSKEEEGSPAPLPSIPGFATDSTSRI